MLRCLWRCSLKDRGVSSLCTRPHASSLLVCSFDRRRAYASVRAYVRPGNIIAGNAIFSQNIVGKYVRRRSFASTHTYSTVRNAHSRELVESSLDRSSSNVSESVLQRIGVELHRQDGHPLNLVKRRIEHYFNQRYDNGGASFETIDSMPPLVSVKQNFDDLLIDSEHPSRSRNDTYYVNDTHVLRCHTSAHQSELLSAGHRCFLATGDVYRCDTIDRSHFPVFHQMEGVRVFSHDALAAHGCATLAQSHAFVLADLRGALEGMSRALFGDEVQHRWVDAFFPFTHPSLELEVLYSDEWMEMLGCGVIQPEVLRKCGIDAERNVGWAFGIGLERIAMALYKVPDIRLFWTADQRFHRQFATATPTGTPPRFEAYSSQPPALRDFSFWLPDDAAAFHENVFCDLVRDTCGDLVEDVAQIDEYVSGEGRRSQCYRLTYRHMDRTLTGDEVDEMHARVRSAAERRLGVVPRV